MLHEVDNTSDHDPVCLVLQNDVSRLGSSMRKFLPRPSWPKAEEEHIAAYK